MSSPNSVGRRRRRRTTPGEAIERVVYDVALSLMSERGIGPSELKLYDIVKRHHRDANPDSEVWLSNGTVYRHWEGGDAPVTERFQRWLRDRIQADDSASTGPQAAASAISELLEDIPTDPLLRQQRLVEIVRVGPAAAFKAEASSRAWKARLVTTLSTEENSEGADLIAAWERSLYIGYRDLYRQLMNQFGLSMRPGYSLRQFAVTVVTLGEGLLVRQGAAERAMSQHPQVFGPSQEQWSLFSVAVLALMREYFQPNHYAANATELPPVQ